MEPREDLFNLRGPVPVLVPLLSVIVQLLPWQLAWMKEIEKKEIRYEQSC